MIKTPLLLMERSITTPLFFFVLMIFSYAVLLFMVFPYFPNFDWLIVDTSLLGLAFLFHGISAFKDPGYL